MIGYSGLEVGQVIEIPGNAITEAAKKFWRQGLFSDVVIKWTKAYGNKAWLEIQLKQQPRISEINYHGIKKSEREDLEMRLGLVKGNQITPNIVDRATTIIKKHFEEKGFKNAEVNIKQTDDLTHENEVIVDIYVDKKEKVKFYIKDGSKLTLVDKITKSVSDLEIGNVLVDIYMDYGTEYNDTDEVMSRGNSYYLGYEVEVSSGSGTILYPSNKSEDSPSDYGVYEKVKNSVKETPNVKNVYS